jgi:hypothetical protein
MGLDHDAARGFVVGRFVEECGARIGEVHYVV